MRYRSWIFYKAILLMCFLFAPFSNLSAIQTDDWIQEGQPYWKFKVASEGAYQIKYNDLQQVSNKDLSAINPAYFTLYRLGNEKPILVNKGIDGKFNPGDHITFYGQSNDGTLDTGLYLNPDSIGDKPQSLYTDSAVYFLTWNQGNPGKRFESYSNKNYQQYPEQDYFIDTAVRTFTEAYNAGRPLNTNVNLLELSYYTEGEGWTSNNIVHWTGKNWGVDIPGFQKGISGAPKPSVSIKLIGATKCGLRSGGNPKFNHKTRVEVDGTKIGSYFYKGYKSKFIHSKVSGISGPKVTFNFFNRGYFDYNLKCDYSKIKYIKIAYPRKYQAQQNLSFHVEEKSSPVFIAFKKFQGNNAFIYDPVTGKRISTKIVNGTVKAVIPTESQGHQLYLTSSSTTKTVNPNKAPITKASAFYSSKSKYLIITNKKLQPSAQAYKQFRANASNFDVKIAYVSRLFNRYSYGQHHALGIRYFLKDLVENKAAPEYLLLIGKGLQPQKLRKGNLIKSDLVPTIGQPPTDNLFVSNLKEEGYPLSLAFPVGRIPASTNQGVRNYLQKVRDYRSALKNGKSGLSQAWRKKFLHISGGKNKRESKRYKSYLADYAQIARNSNYGAQIDVISKTKSIPVDKSQKDFVINAINEGRTLVTYFGHGASEILEVDIGDPSDYRQKKGNYPIFLFSGCIIGNSYTQGRSLPESFLVNNPNKGGIAWMAESAFSFESYLDRYTLNFYKSLTESNYGQTIGKIFKATAHKMRRTNGARDYVNEMQILQKTFHGDPALSVFSPKNPDYTTDQSLINFKPRNPSASLDTFALQIAIQNAGRVNPNDSLYVTVSQQLSTFKKVTYEPLKVKAPKNKDTILYPIAIGDKQFKGNNSFTVNLSNLSGIREIDTTNNSATVETFFPSSSITPLKPLQYAIVNSKQPQLKVQANNLKLEGAAYKFEIDTTPKFNSPVLRKSPSISGDQFGEWQPQLLNKDSTVYYWRAKKLRPDETDWIQRSFMYIDSSANGWAQGHFNQLRRNKTQSMTYFDSPRRKLAFDREPLGRYNITATGATRGKNNPISYSIRYEGPKLFYPGASPGMYILAIDPNEPARLNYESPYNTFDNKATGDGTADDTTSGVFHFNWVKSNGKVDTSVLEDFVAHVRDSIPKGYKVMAFTARKHLIPKLPEAFYKAMESIGSGIIRDIKEKWPYILIGEKGYKPGEASEKTADTTQPIAPAKQLIKASKTIFPLQKKGTITSSLIGPSSNWKDAFLTTNSPDQSSGDSTTYQVIGVGRNGNESLIKKGLQPGAHSLSQVDADQYPFLRLKTTTRDTVNLTPAQLNTWLVHYDYLPEGSIVPQIAYNFHNDTLQQGEKLKISLAYKNISAFPMDSLKTVISVLNQENQSVLKKSYQSKPLNSGDTLFINDTLQTDNLAGHYRLRVKVNPDELQPERHLFNNVMEESFLVKTDQTKPVLDVTFNNRYIKNNAILNPKPLIRIKAKDDNNFYLLADTSRIDVVLTYPNGRENPLNYKNELTFKPAESGTDNEAVVIYKPSDPLPGGKYTLSVTASDATGNESGTTKFSKDFRVRSNAAIVNFRASPNPFQDRTRFLFTLQGRQVPDMMRIRIFTPKGEMVKVITPEQIGPLNMGENQTAFLWNGRNRSGQTVSSGVYFYRVEAYIDGVSVPFRAKGSSQIGDDRIGKLILTR